MYRTPGNRIEQMNRRQLIALAWEDANDELDTEVLRAELMEMHRETE